MKYIVIEIQKFADGTVAIPAPATYDTYLAAAAAYHSILAAAAVSAVPIHSAVILTDVGQQIAMETYNKTESANA